MNYNKSLIGYPSLGESYTPNYTVGNRILIFDKYFPQHKEKVPEYLKMMNNAINNVYTLYYNVVAQNSSNTVSLYCNDFLALPSLSSQDSYTLEIISAFYSDSNIVNDNASATATFDTLSGSLTITYSDTEYYNYLVVLLLTLNCKNNVIINYNIKVPPSINTSTN